MGVPDLILLKPGELTEEEWVGMRSHPQYAYDLLKLIAVLAPPCISHIATTRNGMGLAIHAG
jgi:HD-GYP domain-containing protein (c-di-GMP phosphodiesterase class II)